MIRDALMSAAALVAAVAVGIAFLIPIGMVIGMLGFFVYVLVAIVDGLV